MARSLAENRRIMVLAERPQEDGGLADCVALAGYQVAEVTARDDALGLVRRSHHDAVILDLDPGADVEQVRRLLHKLRRASPGTALLVMADAGIGCWDAKYHYVFWLPITAIALGDTHGNPGTDVDLGWNDLFGKQAHHH